MSSRESTGRPRRASSAGRPSARQLAIAAAVVAAAALAAPPGARAEFVYTAQGRAVFANAGAHLFEYEDYDEAADTAPDFGPWSRTVTAFAYVFEPYDYEFAGGEGEARINSVLANRSITASGLATGYGYGSHTYTGGGGATSTFAVDFTLDLAADRLATFTMSERANYLDWVEGEVYVTLTGPAFGPYDVNFQSVNIGQDLDWERTFVLPAGLHAYHLAVMAIGNGFADQRGTASYDFTFSYVPEPPAMVLAGLAAFGALPLVRRLAARPSKAE